jgi:uncharacterized BrkB/YihY/UPF0761 family membrane protein
VTDETVPADQATRILRLGPGDLLWLVLFLLQGAVLWAAYWVGVFAQFGYDRCAGLPKGTCDDAAGLGALQGIEICIPVFLGIVFVWSLIRFLRRRSRWWIPPLGIAAMIAVCVYAVVTTFASSH